MKFSQAYKIKRLRNDDWFDPILNYDTKLFIDPFLIYKNANGIFINSHEKIINSDFDFENLRWITEFISLPFNPKTLKPIILVPKQYLNRLPTIFSKDFNLYLYNFENERLRNDFNFDIAKKVDKKTIVDIAREAPDIIEKYMRRKEETSSGQSYDIEKDEDNLIKWHDAGEDYVQKNPINFGVPKDEESFYKIIDCILNSFKDYVEFQGGRELLWNDNKTQRNESAAQRTFAGIAIPYCQANNIDISKEVNIGRGPVDFKFSNGFTKKQLIEVKKASSAPNLFRKIKNQLPIYLQGEQAKNGIYLIIRYSNKDDARIEDIRKVIEEINNETNFNIKYFVVNAEKQPSASKK